MRAVVQRVLSASVVVAGEVVGRCGPGLLVFAAAHRDDVPRDAEKLADRVVGLRIFNDDAGKMNLALKDLPPTPLPQILAISNFTLYGDASRSRRPSFMEAAPYEAGEQLFQDFVGALRKCGADVQSGVFGADMQVASINDGPVTLIADS